jgi:hypothetical protein
MLKTSVMAGSLGLTLPDILRLRAKAADNGAERKDTAVIQIWLGGGISQFESWDPKPEAPREIRGPWKSIPTALAGVHFCELLPRQARVLNKMAIIRSVWHKSSGHDGGTTICATGRSAKGHPSMGSVAAMFRRTSGFGVPSYVQMKAPTTANPTFLFNFNAHFLGNSFDPFNIGANPVTSSFEVPNLKLQEGLSLARLEERKGLLAKFDRLKRAGDEGGAVASMDHFQQAAFEMLTAEGTRQAFDLSREDPKLRERYGNHWWGQSALLARRLVEAGVTFVNINTGPDGIFWDIHGGSAGTVKDTMQMGCRDLDAMVSTLVEDIYERGLDKKVLVLVWGEFGRTPTINERAGRDHWPSVGSLALSGGGLRMGQVIGASDKIGGEPVERPIRPQDVLATVYNHLGIDPKGHLVNLSGQPIPILNDGKRIAEL